MKQYSQPVQPDVMPSDTIGYDKQAGAWTYNGQPIRREGLLLVDEPRTPQQIVEELKGVVIEDEDAAVVEEIMHGQEAQQ